mmetsp:Transcript_6621/g.11960  ORF Transcript_6621/g.11960 Transcript_6621/m.11960 type:complete len:131 (+) Transcript_6621:384-776(+)
MCMQLRTGAVEIISLPENVIFLSPTFQKQPLSEPIIKTAHNNGTLPSESRAGCFDNNIGTVSELSPVIDQRISNLRELLSTSPNMSTTTRRQSWASLSRLEAAKARREEIICRRSRKSNASSPAVVSEQE